MSSPADTRLIAALDIGSSKVCALIVTLDDDVRFVDDGASAPQVILRVVLPQTRRRYPTNRLA